MSSRSFVRSGRGLALLAGLAVVAGCNGAIVGASGPSGGLPGTSTGGGAGDGFGGPAASPGSQPSGSSGTPGAEDGARVCAGAAAVPQARLWRLTRTQMRHTLEGSFGFSVPTVETLPDESRLDGFANASDRLGISSALFEYYTHVADEVATQALAKAADLVPCPVASLGTGTCLEEFLTTVGQKAWRRPLTDDDVTRLSALYTAAAADVGAEEGFKTLVQGLVLSANFLFRTELGKDPGNPLTSLTDVELASALSYMMWDGPPDAQLMDAAVKGTLHEPATLLAETKRLYEGTAAPEAMFSFVQQWIEIDDFLDKPKDMMTFPAYSPDVAKDLENETRTAVQAVFFDPAGDRSFRTLFTAPVGYLDARTAGLYGAKASGTTPTATPLDPKQRRGLFTQASFLGAHAEPVNTSVVARGRFMREQVLCSIVPPPPAAFKFDEKVITDDMTAREKFTEHSKNPACKACHALFDVIGFALENYDAIGAWRTTDKNKPIDPTGSIDLPSGGKLQFASFVDMIDQLGKGTDAYDCFAAQFLQYVSGRVKLDDCDRANAARAFADSGYRLDALVKAIVQSPSFINRSN